MAITTMGGGQARADFQIPVPNGDFSVASNDGHVGGALVGGSGTAMIGTGPWSGTYNSAVGLLLQPRLDIAPGVATISGVSNVGVGSIVDTSAYFSQSLGLAYNKSDTYMLTADVDAGSLLGLSLLTKGVGIALLNGGSVLASTSGTGSPMISLNFLSGTEYQLQLTYTTSSSAPIGNIGIELFDNPSGLATVDLIQAVSFSNVTLTQSVPEPASVALMGLGLGTALVARARRKK